MRDEASKHPAQDSEDKKLPPSEKCIFCNKKISEVGGARIIAQKLRGIVLSVKYEGIVDKDYPHQSVKLDDKSDLYVVTWGEKEKWTKSTIEKARNEFLRGLRPWFCQVCGDRKCSKCGFPFKYPMGSDILYDNGCSSHVTIFPFDPGCSNPNCEKYKKRNENQQ